MRSSEREAEVKADVKEKIIQTALDLFKQHGIKSIRMDDIANSLKVSKRTIYEIFADKETLLKESVIYHQDTSKEVIKDIVASSANVLEVILKCYKRSMETHAKVCRAFFEDIKKYPEAYRLIMERRERDNEVAIDFLKQGVDQGVFRSDINFAILQRLVSEQMRSLTDSNVYDGYNLSEVYESIIFIMLRGICTERGAAELDDFITDYKHKQKQQH